MFSLLIPSQLESPSLASLAVLTMLQVSALVPPLPTQLLLLSFQMLPDLLPKAIVSGVP